ncbi:PREDICTED: uncharacterized protein LOC104816225 [Tarenaya hassleriana]|uniref:uncharacterized protein LOC104816225 n=1 Tax=Tarenaya hassleriana TaxID=28532 RepID=UPI00053C0C3D|nr:PREDICTED: uncharacterized protein LOC104816225 [Tarenaya hassleriana]
MAVDSGEPKFSLRLLVDEEKNKVVLAEAGKDFVYVLFSFMALPMGTIVRLLQKHQKPQRVVVGSFNNLYQSVLEMGIDNFQHEACKQSLLYPRPLRDECLKLNVHDTEVTGYFMCRESVNRDYCRRYYSILNILRCSCGQLMDKEIQLPEEDDLDDLDDSYDLGEIDVLDGVSVSNQSSFFITDDLKVVSGSVVLMLKDLKGLGYTGFDVLDEILLDVGPMEVLTLLECLFSSDAPLTDTFLRKQSSQCITRVHDVLAPGRQENADATETDQVVTLDVLFRKKDKKILYVECGEDFIDLLLTFLVVPLESVWEISGSNLILGCIGNLYKSFKGLRLNEGPNASVSKCVPSWYYSHQAQLLGLSIQQPPVIYCNVCEFQLMNSYIAGLDPSHYIRVAFFDPRYDGRAPSVPGRGFLKRGSRFTVTDDLTISPMNSSSAICLIKQLEMDLDEIDDHVISISKAEAISTLRASLMTSAALTTGLGSLLAAKSKGEN